MTYSAVWAAINLIAGTVGVLPLPVFKRLERGKEKVPQDPIYKLLHDRPNEFMDPMTFRETITGHVLTWGNGYAEIERDNAGRPVALWPLLPNKVEPKIVDKRLVYEVTTDTRKVTLQDLQVLHIKGLGWDGLKGYSVIRMAAESLGLGLAAEKYGAQFFGNGARPNGVLEHPGTLTKPAMDALSGSWDDKHAGLTNAQRTAILFEGMKYHAIGIPPEDAQFLQTRQFQVTDVARWYCVPPHMLAEMTNATFSNIEHQSIDFVNHTLMRWLVRWQHECNWKLFSAPRRRTFFCEFTTAALLRGDTKTRFEAYTMGRNGGWLSPNDIRELENANPIEGGDTYLEPLNMKPIGEQPNEEPDEEPEDDTERSRALLTDAWGRIVTREVNAIRKALNKPDEFHRFLTDFYTKHVVHVERILSPALGVVFGDSVDVPDIASRYVAAGRKGLETALSGVEGDEIRERIEPILEGWSDKLPHKQTELLLEGRTNRDR